ncbi:galactokinase [Altererythrobacter lutimaris]|uniref:Galactokinase n=1 Tax=Altererythrobacter lutimaris TaxID=2743979 RepID=A0A850H2E4_9SPHN|nr:galactokinase [Altererythrobacter lutimaris]NVE93284.1 galactokinase [Altererythrobacter lutimaris]
MSESFRAFCPARVNLIGEHIDYNGGTVLPAALAIGITVELRPRDDRQVTIRSAQHEGLVTRLLDDAFSDHWADPALGAVIEAKSLGLLSGGADIAINSTMPAGSGLSSSAALMVAILKAARDARGDGTNDVELAVAARRVENNFLGVPCGIMDQMAVALASPGKAMALQTETLDWKLLDLIPGYSMAVIHSGITRKLTDGQYAARKVECDAAKEHFQTDDLCHLDETEIEAAELPANVRRRALHCVTENTRVLAAIEALGRSDATQLGALMNESHVSMRDLFEMSLPPIDTLVEDAVRFGAVGARLTGGGFGGCIVACVADDRLDEWQSRLLAAHESAYPIASVSSPAA